MTGHCLLVVYVRLLRCLDLWPPDVAHQFSGIIVYTFCQYRVEYPQDLTRYRYDRLHLL